MRNAIETSPPTTISLNQVWCISSCPVVHERVGIGGPDQHAERAEDSPEDVSADLSLVERVVRDCGRSLDDRRGGDLHGPRLAHERVLHRHRFPLRFATWLPEESLFDIGMGCT